MPTTDPKRSPPREKPGRSDIDDSNQAANTRKPSQADLSDKSGMLSEGGETHRDDGAHNRAI